MDGNKDACLKTRLQIIRISERPLMYYSCNLHSEKYIPLPQYAEIIFFLNIGKVRANLTMIIL